MRVRISAQWLLENSSSNTFWRFSNKIFKKRQ